MKNTAIQISIPQPCHEDWQAMTTVDKGRFCGACMKNVIDFTTKSDREILEAFKKDDKLCGRFKNTQLNREIEVVEKKSSVWFASTTAFITLLGVESQEVMAQEKQNTEQHENFMLGKMMAPSYSVGKTIKGTVSDNVGPLPGANVAIKGTKISTQTDLDGNFSIEAKENDVIVISFIGLKTIEKKVDENNLYKIELKQSEIHLQGEVLIYKKRTFFSKIFYSIRNWFR